MFMFQSATGLDDTSNTAGAQHVYLSENGGHLFSDVEYATAGMNCMVTRAISIKGEEEETQTIRASMYYSQAFLLLVTEQFLRAMDAGNIPEEYATARMFMTPIIAVAENNDLLQRYHKATRTADGLLRTDHDFVQTLTRRLTEFVVPREKKATLKKAWEYNSTGAARSEEGDFRQAAEWLQKALTLKETLPFAAPPHTAFLICNIAQCYRQIGEMSAAVQWADKALTLNRQRHGDEHPHTAYAYRWAGEMAYRSGNVQDAKEYLLHAFAIYYNTFGREDEDTEMAIRILATFFLDSGGTPKELSAWMKQRTGLSMTFTPSE